MGKIDGKMLSIVLGLILVVLGGASILKGGYYLGKHEGDTMHLLQMVLRMAEGEWPHLDFVTPIGALAMAPMAWLVSMGLGVGSAILWSQVLVAVIAFPAILWVARSRYQGLWQILFGALVLILILALVHGETNRAVSISMHYNRWAWAATFLAVSLAVLPARRQGPVLDGLVIGVAMAVMLLTKATYFLMFFLPVLVALLSRRQMRTLGVGVVSGLVVLGLVTLAAGTPVVWLAYLRDLTTVMASDVRPRPGIEFGATIGAPPYMIGSLALIASIIWLRQSGRKVEGLVMLLLTPAFFYVTYQNFGNDPQWLPLLAVMLFALLPEAEVKNGWGLDLGTAMRTTAIVALCMGGPTVINLAYSPFRHLKETPEDYTALLPHSGVHEDIRTPRIRAHRVDAIHAVDGPGTPYEAFFDAEYRERDRVTWRGEELALCEMDLGMVAWFQTMADRLVATGMTEGKTAFVADLLNGFWMFGAFEPLKGNAPWYYGGLTGLESADYVVVPLCPQALFVRKQILGELEEAEVALDEVLRDELFILYEIKR